MFDDMEQTKFVREDGLETSEGRVVWTARVKVLVDVLFGCALSLADWSSALFAWLSGGVSQVYLTCPCL